MSRNGTLILLGVLVILTPFSGLPMNIRSLLAVILGACVLGIGFSMRAREARSASAQLPVEAPPSEPAPPQTISPI